MTQTITASTLTTRKVSLNATRYKTVYSMFGDDPHHRSVPTEVTLQHLKDLIAVCNSEEMPDDAIIHIGGISDALEDDCHTFTQIYARTDSYA